MANQSAQENIGPDKNFKNQANGVSGNPHKEKDTSWAGGDELTTDDQEMSGQVYSKNLMSPAEKQVRESEDASLQDDTYAFDEANTQNDEYHDAERTDEEGLDSGEYT